MTLEEPVRNGVQQPVELGGVDTGGDHDRDVDHPPTLANVDRQGVGGEERVGPASSGRVWNE